MQKNRITQTAATVATLMGFAMQEQADTANETVLAEARNRLGTQKLTRALLYNPDAVALWLYNKYPEYFTAVERNADLTLPVYTVMPSVTPVCFASMYTGLQPKDHGIQAYVKPVLQVQTLFDAALANGLKPIIISTAGDSISKIFLERDMEYIICQTPDECNERALEVIEKDEHNIIVVYNGNYDAKMHRTGPEAPEALEQLRHNERSYEMLAQAAKKAWAGKPAMSAYLPDHGCHEIDGNLGSHGLEMDEDMNIVHFYHFFH